MVIQVSCCVACLSPIEPHFRIIKPGLVKIYKSILPVAEHVPVDLCIYFCVSCEGNLIHLDQFRSNCVSSLVNLVNIAGIKETYICPVKENSDILSNKTRQRRILSTEKSFEMLKMIQGPVINTHETEEADIPNTEFTTEVINPSNEVVVASFPKNEVTLSESEQSITLIMVDELPEENDLQRSLNSDSEPEPENINESTHHLLPNETIADESNANEYTLNASQTEQPLQCVYCKKDDFVCRKSLNAHIRGHLNSKYECHFCGKLMSKYSLQRHLYQHIDDAPYQCNHCRKPCYSKEEFDTHMAYEEKRRERIRRTCEKCGYVATRMSVLRLHMSIKHEGESQVPPSRIMCDICKKVLREKSYKGHMLTKHSVDKSRWFSCDKCDRKFPTSKAVRVHFGKEHEFIKCHICHKLVGSGTIKKHIESVHPELRQWECPVIWCNVEFKIEATLVKHLYQHTKTRPYNCTICDSGYYNTQYLKIHYEKTHNMTKLKPEWLRYQFPDLSRVRDAFKNHLPPQTVACLDKIRKKCERNF